MLALKLVHGKHLLFRSLPFPQKFVLYKPSPEFPNSVTHKPVFPILKNSYFHYTLEIANLQHKNIAFHDKIIRPILY